MRISKGANCMKTWVKLLNKELHDSRKTTHKRVQKPSGRRLFDTADLSGAFDLLTRDNKF